MGDKTTYLNPPPGRVSRLARLVSNVVNPVVAGVFIAGLTAYQAIQDPLLTVKWFGLTVLLTLIPPLSYIVYLVKTGYLVDIFMPDRRRRIKPIAFIVAWVLLSALFLGLVGAPLPIVLVLLITVLLVGSLLGITLIWKISFHTAILTTAATVTVLLGVSQAWFISLLIPLVGWSRVRLRRHTTSQVIAGSAAGCAVALVGYYFLRVYLKF